MNKPNEAERSERDVPLSALPFRFDGIEEQYGRIRRAEIECPGVYYICTGPTDKHLRVGSEYMVVVDSPVISQAALAYGTPLPTDPIVRLYPCDAFDKGANIIQYEIDKYLSEHDGPLLGGTLHADIVFGQSVCPEYFGELPIPTETPWGVPLRSDRMWNGFYWLETERAGWVLAVAYPFSDWLSFKTKDAAKLLPHDLEVGIDETLGYRFYNYETSCIPAFELLEEGEGTWRPKINEAALKNAILKYQPEYAAAHSKYSRAPISETPGAGTCFYRFPISEG